MTAEKTVRMIEESRRRLRDLLQTIRLINEITKRSPAIRLAGNDS